MAYRLPTSGFSSVATMEGLLSSEVHLITLVHVFPKRGSPGPHCLSLITHHFTPYSQLAHFGLLPLSPTSPDMSPPRQWKNLFSVASVPGKPGPLYHVGWMNEAIYCCNKMDWKYPSTKVLPKSIINASSAGIISKSFLFLQGPRPSINMDWVMDQMSFLV